MDALDIVSISDPLLVLLTTVCAAACMCSGTAQAQLPKTWTNIIPTLAFGKFFPAGLGTRTSAQPAGRQEPCGNALDDQQHWSGTLRPPAPHRPVSNPVSSRRRQSAQLIFYSATLHVHFNDTERRVHCGASTSVPRTGRRRSLCCSRCRRRGWMPPRSRSAPTCCTCAHVRGEPLLRTRGNDCYIFSPDHVSG
jgi:hypothetical protein